MKMFQASFSQVITRFYIMAAVGIASISSGQIWMAIFCLPIFLSAMLGVEFSSKTVNVNRKAQLSQLTRTQVKAA